jgi:hypothetical protein
VVVGGDIKVIRQGVRPDDSQRGTCGRCGCVAECAPWDASRSLWHGLYCGDWSVRWVDCPTCGAALYLKPKEKA